MTVCGFCYVFIIFFSSLQINEAYLVVDGELIPEHPVEMLRKGNFKKNFNVIISTVDEETSGLLQFLAGYLMGEEIGQKFAFENADSLSTDDAIKVIAKLSGQYVTKSPSLDDISKVYFNGIRKDEDENVLRKMVGKAFGDVWLACPTIEFGQEMAKNSHKNDDIRVYQLYSTFKLNEKPFCPKWAGTCHMDDLFPMFGMPIQYADHHHQRERDISREFLSLLHSFLRYGYVVFFVGLNFHLKNLFFFVFGDTCVHLPSQPNQSEQPEWKPYSMIGHDNDRQLVAPSYELSNDYPTYQNYHLNLHTVQCKFWQRHY